VEIRMPLEEAQRLLDRGSTFVHSVQDCGQGEARVLIRSTSEAWITPLVLGYAGRAQVVRPARMRRAVIRAAQEATAAYEATDSTARQESAT